MSSVSEMQWKVDEQRRLNSELRSELNAIISGISAAYRRWDSLCARITGSLSEGAKRVSASQDYMDAAYDMQSEIDNMYVLFKNIETANKKIRECNNRKIYEFANYSAVRKIVCAMLDNIEVAFVSDETIAKAVEMKHLQIPDYWLTCALLSIMAWRNNDKALADQAIERACRLDKKETAVFFLAFNLRMGRESAALKWFDYYCSCDLTGEDDRTFLLLFSIINKAVGENCGDEVVSRVSSFINRVIADDMARSGYSEEAVISRIIKYLYRFVPNEPIGYTMLMKYCSEGEYLTSQMMLAKANINILDFILKTVNITDKQRRDYLNSFIEGVVNKPNSVELEVEDEILYNELIIRHQGNIEAARAEFENMKTHREEDFDIVAEMIDWIYDAGSDEDVNPMVKANMFAVTKDLNRKAVDIYTGSYRSRFKTVFDITINDYHTSADLADENGELGKLQAFSEAKKAEKLSAVKIWPSFIGFGAAVLSLVGAIAIPALPLLALTIAGAAYGVINIFSCRAKKAHIIRDCDNEFSVNSDILKGIIAEFAAYTEEYNEYDSYSRQIGEEFDKF